MIFFSQNIIVVQMYEIMKIQMYFWSNKFIFFVKTFIDVYMLEKYLRIKFIVFIWTKYEKKSG
jgi:hypothetical protein